MDKKSISTTIILAIIVISIILIINYLKTNNNGDQNTIQCIAQNSQLFLKEGCPACASQKNVLGNNLNKFDIIDCTIEPRKCSEFEITRIPTWIIKREKYIGVHSIEELKELTGC